MKKFLMASVLMLASVGCVAQQDRDLISTGAAVGHGNLRDWDKLTDAEQREAHFNLVAGYHVLDHNINGKDLPAEYAPVTSATGQ